MTLKRKIRAVKETLKDVGRQLLYGRTYIADEDEFFRREQPGQRLTKDWTHTSQARGRFSPRRDHSASTKPRTRPRMEIATARFSPLKRPMKSAKRGRTKLDDLREELPTGYSVHTWSPGDGVTRYRFFHNAPSSQTFFGPANGTYTALGFKKACTFARGLLDNRPGGSSPKHRTHRHKSK